jgi:hypothetical protein
MPADSFRYFLFLGGRDSSYSIDQMCKCSVSPDFVSVSSIYLFCEYTRTSFCMTTANSNWALPITSQSQAVTRPEGDVLSLSMKLPSTKLTIIPSNAVIELAVAILLPPLAKEITFTGPSPTLIRPTQCHETSAI